MMRLMSFLTSLWGGLTAVAVLFPGAAVILKLPIAVENSKIAELYPAFGCVIAAFSLLMISVYKDKLIDLSVARTISTIAAITAVLALFVFVGIRTFALDIDFESRIVDRERNLIIQDSKNKGLIMYIEKVYAPTEVSPPEIRSVKGDPWDLGCLAAFILMFSSLTVAFGALGIHVYHKNMP